MSKFVLVYRSAEGYRPSEETVQRWNDWFGDVEAAVADFGQGVVEVRSVGNCTDRTALGGNSILDAPDFDTAFASKT